MVLNLDPWWDEPAYKAAQGTFSERGAFILAKLQEHDAAKLKDVMADLYRDAVPDPTEITKFEWETILRYPGSTRRRSTAGGTRTPPASDSSAGTVGI